MRCAARSIIAIARSDDLPERGRRRSIGAVAAARTNDLDRARQALRCAELDRAGVAQQRIIFEQDVGTFNFEERDLGRRRVDLKFDGASDDDPAGALGAAVDRPQRNGPIEFNVARQGLLRKPCCSENDARKCETMSGAHCLGPAASRSLIHRIPPVLRERPSSLFPSR